MLRQTGQLLILLDRFGLPGAMIRLQSNCAYAISLFRPVHPPGPRACPGARFALVPAASLGRLAGPGEGMLGPRQDAAYCRSGRSLARPSGNRDHLHRIGQWNPVYWRLDWLDRGARTCAAGLQSSPLLARAKSPIPRSRHSVRLGGNDRARQWAGETSGTHIAQDALVGIAKGAFVLCGNGSFHRRPNAADVPNRPTRSAGRVAQHCEPIESDRTE